ncbi:uncharacterized protein AMSG_02947 [Thecamonas trahens ATCC 50062]|uniref:Uncharacterized protein n=1 Tax=Thecamonas trahens ATCC 50062 TaxID=461836 RepID=A0A0L0D2T5_THETB|nr:hypothetical protein AMSG_02947 [Thecamonas trahens ATCC 50062]KNC46511.1 hypothetical protein AMSG_02947 [Thecamonas trahens ATCC 50062]|eukprot:XP_013760292.1 hypothetical protein AMSG_02947 [Thecamonas trahens ATCC 50062]
MESWAGSTMQTSHPTIEAFAPLLQPAGSDVVLVADSAPGSLASPSRATKAARLRLASLRRVAALRDLDSLLPPPIANIRPPPTTSAAARRLGLVPPAASSAPPSSSGASDGRRGGGRSAGRRRSRMQTNGTPRRSGKPPLPPIDTIGVIQVEALELDADAVFDVAGEAVTNVSALKVSYNFLNVWLEACVGQHGSRKVFDLAPGSEGARRLDAVVAGLPWPDDALEPYLVFSVLDTSLPVPDQEIAYAQVHLGDILDHGGMDFIHEDLTLLKLRSALGPSLVPKHKLVPAGTLRVSIVLRQSLLAAQKRVYEATRRERAGARSRSRSRSPTPASSRRPTPAALRATRRRR